MTAMFDRQGNEVTGPFVARKGGVGVHRVHLCNRCGGAGGSSRWDHTGWTCYGCGGSGKGSPYVMPVYTAEKLAALNATKAKADAKRQAVRDAKAEADRIRADAERVAFMAEHAAFFEAMAMFAGRVEFVDDIVAKAKARAMISFGQMDACRAAVLRLIVKDQERAVAAHQGEIGQRMTFSGRVTSIMQFGERFDAYGIRYLTTFRTERGLVSYMGSRTLAAEGDTITLSGAVKEHRTLRNGEPVTAIGRPTKIEVKRAAKKEEAHA